MSYNQSLNPNSNYPAMTQSQWDDAPFNEPVIPERDFDIVISQSLSKDVTVCTNNYIPEYDEEDGHTYANTEDTDWVDVVKDNELHTPLQLIHILKEVLEKDLKAGIVFKNPRITQKLIEECEGWQEDETEFIEN